MAIRLSRSEQRRLGIAPAPSGKSRGMNKLEARFAEQLEAWKLAGEVIEWRYEPSKLVLARRTTYTPDFFARFADGREVMYECKGFMRDDASVKIKVAADKYRMYQFVIVKWKRGEWVFKEVKP